MRNTELLIELTKSLTKSTKTLSTQAMKFFPSSFWVPKSLMFISISSLQVAVMTLHWSRNEKNTSIFSPFLDFPSTASLKLRIQTLPVKAIVT